MLVKCPRCGKIESRPHSCGHRSCPKCQNFETTEWLFRQRQKLLPVPYFLVTFTIPGELRKTARRYQSEFFEIMFRSAKETLQEMAENERYLGGQIGNGW
ncbi:MAG: transposase zinc-binding domain-containing protein [Candidatus Riflebacteria bacterium]|nr:transposase zinc-binding domain-containing protein [Candidatus Riflebacteria bacterium]